MKHLTLLLLILALLSSCKTEKTQPIEDGTYVFTLMFSEFMERSMDVPCDVIIEGTTIRVQQNQYTKLEGPKVLLQGNLMQHISGKWIVSDNEDDKHATEIGGCTEITVIDFEKKIVVWC